MRVQGKNLRTIWNEDDRVFCVDQTRLPFELVTIELTDVHSVIQAIKEMKVRGAPAIGVAGAYGVYLAARAVSSKGGLKQAVISAAEQIREARPTAVNLSWAVDRQLLLVDSPHPDRSLPEVLLEGAKCLAEEDIDCCRRIGEHGLKLLKDVSADRGRTRLNIMTHCNAGWLACVDYGTATAPLYLAHEQGIAIHVWVSETRPRNQGSFLTAWELGQAGVPHTLIVDNAAGILMQRGEVDVVIVGTDRTTAQGDVANKVGTYLKALAAKAHGIPFYVAAPSSSIDFSIIEGVGKIPIEDRSGDEVTFIKGLSPHGVETVRIAPPEVAVCNLAFDVTPSCLITGLITERGSCAATREGIAALFPDRSL